jgi:hypothetical protein
MTATERAAFIAAAERAQQACREAARGLQQMLADINAERIARGVPPLDVELQMPGEPA